jgi:hypothetical protein
MRANSPVKHERELYTFCQHAAQICNSREFKQLHKEISKLYRKQGIPDFRLIAFQDSLYTLYIEWYEIKETIPDSDRL